MKLPLRLLPVGVNRRHVIAVTLLGFIWLMVMLRRLEIEAIHFNLQQRSDIDAFDFPPLNSAAIRSMCAETKWNASLVFTCRNSVGGIANIRNSILSCVRYAIWAGASLVEPEIIVRDAEDTAIIRTAMRTNMDYMLDSSHFRKSLQLSCRGLALHKTIDAVRGSLDQAIALLPESLESDDIPASGLEHPEAWRDSFTRFLSEQVTLRADSKAVINLQRSYLKYPIYTDGATFALSFGKILKFRSDTRILATKTLDALAIEAGYSRERRDFEKPYLAGLFLGAHLRTEHDAQLAWPARDWTYSRYETQAKLYLDQANTSCLEDIYVASGEAAEISKFTSDALAQGRRAHTKHSLLSPSDVESLNRLSWDQQGMVDFLVMLKSSDFAGVGHSSFSWNVALLRHGHAQKKDHLSGPQILSDELSQIYGRPRQYPEYAACLWP